MPGLVPGIHVLPCRPAAAIRWNLADALFAIGKLVDGRPSPTMTAERARLDHLRWFSLIDVDGRDKPGHDVRGGRGANLLAERRYGWSGAKPDRARRRARSHQRRWCSGHPPRGARGP